MDEFSNLILLATHLPVVIAELEQLDCFQSRLFAWRDQCQQLIDKLFAPVDMRSLDADHSTFDLPSSTVIEELLKFPTTVSIELPETSSIRRVSCPSPLRT